MSRRQEWLDIAESYARSAKGFEESARTMEGVRNTWEGLGKPSTAISVQRVVDLYFESAEANREKAEAATKKANGFWLRLFDTLSSLR